MKIGDIVYCKSRGKAVIINIENNKKTVSVLFLRPGMYNPEIVEKEDLEVIHDN